MYDARWVTLFVFSIILFACKTSVQCAQPNDGRWMSVAAAKRSSVRQSRKTKSSYETWTKEWSDKAGAKAEDAVGEKCHELRLTVEGSLATPIQPEESHYWIETLVFADHTVRGRFASLDEAQDYVITLMRMVSTVVEE
ncbi:unnamed protein product [Echinostoma caproni]|uniref:DUF3568 family protein n=1 Tax=Echinostoma caproni TaxID=27848 RepID=A0A183ASA3_9TREM|nr:unnamed protein product [Echinostoma caproni]